MEPIILHSDMNNFYASVEILYDHTLKDKPVAVAGDEETRHGIVLAKNDLAKRFGVYTGQVLWELSLFSEERKAQRRTDIDRVMDCIRVKYGYFSIRRAITLLDPALDLDAKGDHTIHPVGFLGTL